VQGIKRLAIVLGLAMLAVGAVLYVTLADPATARSVTPSVIPFESVHLILLAMLGALIVAFVQNLRRFTG
jgi:hypothetical protein